MKIFCKRLIELRLEKEILQRNVADFMHVVPHTVSSWENGKNFPSLKKLSQLADFFEVSTDYLLGRTDNY